MAAISTMIKPKYSAIYEDYWRLAAERQNIFFKRLNGHRYPWTDDEIFIKYKFTNSYRASDRVSQYLISNVIYKGHANDIDTIFRIILFKIFNKIETWELLNAELNAISIETFNYGAYDKVLTHALNSGKRIYSAAYMMPSGSSVFNTTRKHQAHLKLLEIIVRKRIPELVQQSSSMEEGYNILLSLPMIGRFLAYQYITDINYSEAINFSEMSFVMPGPGALSGISKFFTSLGDYSPADAIKLMADMQEIEFERLGIDFKNLWGRRLQLIDCQNLFCEFDKYCRVKHPDVVGVSKRKKIKQLYKESKTALKPWYPPKWGINSAIYPEGHVNV